jgi:hypothetical protein
VLLLVRAPPANCPRSYQLRADEWISDTTQGALVHFTEASLNASDAINVTTPWIAYISCDANETGASDFWGQCSQFNPVLLMT